MNESIEFVGGGTGSLSRPVVTFGFTAAELGI
jgi:hypothetical protein